MGAIRNLRRAGARCRRARAAFEVVFCCITLHIGHEERPVNQEMPRPLMWLISRYEHILMRTINYMARSDWLYRLGVTGRLIDWLSHRVMNYVNGEVLTLEEVVRMMDSLFDSGYTVATGTCPCRRARNMLSDDVPNNTDMVFGRWAEEYLEHYPGLYRRLERDEAKSLARNFDRHGFLHQVYGYHTRDGAAYVLCNCDPEVCIPLNAQKERGFKSFRRGRSVAVLDAGRCLGVEECGICLRRCPFDARFAQGDEVRIDPDACFGCGLCVSTCRGRATGLERRPGARLVYARYLVG